MIPQAMKDLWKDPKTHAVGLGVLAYMAPLALQGFLAAGHMTPEQWAQFVVEVKAAWQHAAAAWTIILPVVLAIVKAARELYLAPAGHVIVPLPATQVATAAFAAKEGD